MSGSAPPGLPLPSSGAGNFETSRAPIGERLAVTGIFCWHFGQATVTEPALGIFPSGIESFAEQAVQIRIIAELPSARPGVGLVHTESVNVGRHLTARMLDLIDA